MKSLNAILMGGLFVLCSCTQPTQKEAVKADEGKNVVIENIMARRSIRKYKDQPVEREKLLMITGCGINAPSGMNQQPWEVRVVDNADYINGITEIYKKENPKTRHIFILRYYFNMAVKDIADSLEMSEQAVSSRLMRARNNLRKFLSEKGVEV